MRGVREQFRSESAEHARIAQSELFGVEKGVKALKGRLEALQDPEVFNVKRKQEAELRDYVNADPATRKSLPLPEPLRQKITAYERLIPLTGVAQPS